MAYIVELFRSFTCAHDIALIYPWIAFLDEAGTHLPITEKKKAELAYEIHDLN